MFCYLSCLGERCDAVLRVFFSPCTKKCNIVYQKVNHLLSDCPFCLLQVSVSSLQTLLTRYVESLVHLMLVCLSDVSSGTQGGCCLCFSFVSVMITSLLLSSHRSTSALWRTALSVCLCCWPQQSKQSNGSVITTHDMPAVLPPFRAHRQCLCLTTCVQFSHAYVFLVVSQMWWCQRTPRTAGPVFSSLFTSP